MPNSTLLGGGQANRAVECFRSACSGPVPTGPEVRKDFLTYQLNLGVALAMTGRLDEAETALRRNLQERLAFYGREHAGYTHEQCDAGAGKRASNPSLKRNARGEKHRHERTVRRRQELAQAGAHLVCEHRHLS